MANKPDQVMLQKIYVPAFVKSCALRGVQLTDADLPSALQIVDRLRQVHANDLQKQSQQVTGVIKSAAAALDQHLGLAAPVRDTRDVSAFLQDPEIVAALNTAG